MEGNYQNYDTSQGANPHYGYPHNGMVYYPTTPLQQQNIQWVQDFNQPAPPSAFDTQPTSYEGYSQTQYQHYQQDMASYGCNQLEYAPEQQYQDQQHHQQDMGSYGYNQTQYAPEPQFQDQQHHKQDMANFEPQNEESNLTSKLCHPCRAIIRNKLIPVLNEIGCFDQPDNNEIECDQRAQVEHRSGSVVNPNTGDGESVANEVGATNCTAVQQEPELNNAVVDEIQASNAANVPRQPVAAENVVETLPATFAAEIVHQQSNEEMEVGAEVLEAATQDIVAHPSDNSVAYDEVEAQEDRQTLLDESVEMRVSDVAVEKPEFDIGEIEFGYTPETPVETVPPSPSLNIEQVVALNDDDYVAVFPSLAPMNAESIVEAAIISKTMKKKLKKEKTVGKEGSAAPQAARKRQRKPKRLVTLSDVFDSSDAQTTQPSISKTSSAILKKDHQSQNKMSKSVPHKMLSENVRSSSRGHGTGHRTSKTTGKKQSAINAPQLRNRPNPSSTVPINAYALKPSVGADQNVSVSQKKETTVEKRRNNVERGQRYMSKAERRQLNKGKPRRRQQGASSMPSEGMDPTPPGYASIDEDTETNPLSLTNENSSDEVQAASVSAQELELKAIEEVRTTLDVEEAAKVEVLPAKTRRLMFNSNLREKKKSGKGNQTKDGHVNEKEDSGKGHNMENDGYEQQKEDHSEQPSSEICVRNETIEFDNDFLKGAVSKQGSSLETSEETSSKAEDGLNTPTNVVKTEEKPHVDVGDEAEDEPSSSTHPLSKSQKKKEKKKRSDAKMRENAPFNDFFAMFEDEILVNEIRAARDAMDFLRKVKRRQAGDLEEGFLNACVNVSFYEQFLVHVKDPFTAFHSTGHFPEAYEQERTGLGKQILKHCSLALIKDWDSKEIKEVFENFLRDRIVFHQSKHQSMQRKKLISLLEAVLFRKSRLLVEDVHFLTTLRLDDKEQEKVDFQYLSLISHCVSPVVQCGFRNNWPTVTSIRKNVETSLGDESLQHFCQYIPRQFRIRNFGFPLEAYNLHELYFYNLFQKAQKDLWDVMLADEDDCPFTKALELLNAREDPRDNEFIPFLDFLTKIRSSVIASDVFLCLEIGKVGLLEGVIKGIQAWFNH
ncbi:unnamed protein product [Caenorhabditis brenneri]